MTALMLKQLTAVFHSHPSREETSTTANDRKQDGYIERWIEAGRPHSWLEVETDGEFTVLLDVGYGYMALFKGAKLVTSGKDSLVYNSRSTQLIILDKDFYGVNKYIWK